MSKQREQALLTEITERVGKVNAIWDAAGDEQLDAKTKQEVITLNKEIEERELEVKEIREQAELREQNAQRQRESKEAVNRLGPGKTKDKPEEQHQSPGLKVINDPAFKAWRDSLMIGSAITSGRFGSSPRVSLPGGFKALVTGLSDTSGGALQPAYQYYPGMVQGTYQRPLNIRDLLTTGTTESDAIEYALEGTPTNNAAPVAEATDVSGSSGAKPQSDIALSKATTTVKTIAHWVGATRRALADAGILRMYIETFLRYGLDEELEDQVLNGDGTGENFLGILNTPNTQSQAWDTNLLTTLRRARTKVRVTGRATPTAYVLHPNDWEDIDLAQDNEGRYYYGGPAVLGVPRLWGLPVVESEGMTEGTGVVGDWRRAVLLDREQTQILVSDSHADFFVRNLIALLAELRAAFFVIRPQAFVEADLTP